jgi:sugar lactone lactonase YvrE
VTDYKAAVVREGLYFGEGPRWHDGRLWYSDFYDHAVHALDPGGEDERVVEVAAQPSGLGWMPDGSLLIVSMIDRKVLRLGADHRLVEHADLFALVPFHCNDMVVDAQGRAYVGNFGFDLEAVVSGASSEQPSTVLIRIDPDGRTIVVAADLQFPNGAVITPDGATFILAESMGSRLTAFDIGADGSLGNRRVWADLAPLGVVPDGICLDASGAVWVANARGPAAVRVAEGGEVLDTVTFSQDCFACMLGGAEGDELFGLTAPSSSAAVVSVSPMGRIESARVDVAHAGRP